MFNMRKIWNSTSLYKMAVLGVFLLKWVEFGKMYESWHCKENILEC